MIGFFPEPYPDELLYSLCARYGKRANYPNKRMVVEELFGNKNFSATVDLPNRLEDLLSIFPSQSYTAAELINRHTLFPFYEPFVSPEKAAHIRNEMSFSKENNIRTRLGLNIPQVRTAEYMRFCPLCVQSDIKEHGRTYWHRIHQLTGVLVCAEHDCFLQNSFIALERQSSYNFYCADDDSLNIQPPQFLDSDNQEHKLFLYLADNAEWLLSRNGLCLEEGLIRDRYYNLLLERGFAYYNGRIRNGQLCEAFNSHFSPQTLEKLGCTLISAQKGWLPKMLEQSRADVIQHPVRHLLLMYFLGIKAVEFFTSFNEYKPFGNGPYPCLNSGSDHYGELKIESCLIVDNVSKTNSGKPLGIFSCQCGFIYQRIGPDASDETRMIYNSVREYGKVWEDNLKEFWMKVNIPLSEIARIFRVSELLIVRHAIRLNLPMNESDTRVVRGYERHRNPKKTFSDLLSQHRQNWLEIIKNHSGFTRQNLLDKFSTLYLWLRRNDSDWFEQNLPETESKWVEGELLDWKNIDNELSREVEQACRDILQQINPLVRVGITEIIKRIGNKTWLEKRDLKLPRTTAVIKRYSETLEDFMLRKIEAAEAKFIGEGTATSRSGFVEYARLKNSTSKNSARIQQAIISSVTRIQAAAIQLSLKLD